MGQVLGGDLGERFRVWGGICCKGGYTVDGRNVIGWVVLDRCNRAEDI